MNDPIAWAVSTAVDSCTFPHHCCEVHTV